MSTSGLGGRAQGLGRAHVFHMPERAYKLWTIIKFHANVSGFSKQTLFMQTVLPSWSRESIIWWYCLQMFTTSALPANLLPFSIIYVPLVLPACLITSLPLDCDRSYCCCSRLHLSTWAAPFWEPWQIPFVCTIAMISVYLLKESLCFSGYLSIIKSLSRIEHNFSFVLARAAFDQCNKPHQQFPLPHLSLYVLIDGKARARPRCPDAPDALSPATPAVQTHQCRILATGD